jgi:hypothetical protein
MGQGTGRVWPERILPSEEGFFGRQAKKTVIRERPFFPPAGKFEMREISVGAATELEVF